MISFVVLDSRIYDSGYSLNHITASPKTPGFQTGDEGEERFQDSADMEGEVLESLNTRKPRTLSPRKLIKIDQLVEKYLIVYN